jgi:hypothetical protein
MSLPILSLVLVKVYHCLLNHAVAEIKAGLFQTPPFFTSHGVATELNDSNSFDSVHCSQIDKKQVKLFKQ